MVAMDTDFLEAMAECADDDARRLANQWFSDQGLTVIHMRAGLLLSGDVATFERVFGLSLQDVTGPFELPVPQQVGQTVSWVGIPKPRQYTNS